ncbi:dynein regulatory complex protein 1 isoform X2 [Periplaneta americana]|uniref:dynein regulatory complex protein 1 isoform X2 n=1 Tax=Periplaneta americana TaxID=6978 RepID=UPI0037E742F4
MVRQQTPERKEQDPEAVDKQLEASEAQLERLLLEGKELVTNVRIANDTREVKRRENERAAREKRLQRLEDQATESMDKFNEVNSKWEVILKSNDPLSLYHDIEEQKEKCAELIAQKDQLIKELKLELKLADELFDEDQKKQKEDLWLLAERIDNQVKVMRRGYKEELKLIEEVIELEHEHLMQANDKKWEALYKEREELEVTHMNKKFEAVDKHEEEIYRVAVEHYEKFREVKIKLETDIQVLQQELEQVKTQCLINKEKLVYNFQVLKKREEENIIVQAQQKRSSNRLQDVVSNLKREIAETEKSTKIESEKLTEEVIKLQHSIMDIENRAEHIAKVNDRKYQQLWKLNQDAAEKLLKKILDIDRVIHEQQLGLEWTPPDLSLLRQEDLVSYHSAKQVFAELLHKKDTHSVVIRDVENLYAKEKLKRNILELIADKSDFLVEQQLKKLLAPYSDTQKTLIKLDSIFTALGVKTEEDMQLLKTCFMPYAKCSICDISKEEKEVATVFRGSHESLVSSSTTGDTETMEVGTVAEIVEKQEDRDMDVMTSSEATLTPIREKLSFVQKKAACSETHPLVIDNVYVLKGLRDFAAKVSSLQHRAHKTLTSSLTVKPSTMSRLLSPQDITAYWTRFREIFSPQQEKLWDGLLFGLQRYHRILEDRHNMNIETEKLRKQNAELRRLLQPYIQYSENESKLLASRKHLPPLARNAGHRRAE